jgi:hypothetical protein
VGVGEKDKMRTEDHSLSVTPVGIPALNTAYSLRNTQNIYKLISIATVTILIINLTEV